jgi:hypothetical protein
MNLPRIFIASSSEGKPASKAIVAELEKMLNGNALIHHWEYEFNLSDVYIESLEKILAKCDFGIFVLTADDVLHSRHQQHSAPRDNVIFELGLFMGGIGRDRCFVFKETGADNSSVKTPSDILGLETATFTTPDNNDWAAALRRNCERVSKRVLEYGQLYRLTEEVVSYKKAAARFIRKLEGCWWEYLQDDEAGQISFFEIEADDVFNSIRMKGRAFSGNGKLMSRWNSQMVRLLPDQEKLLYHWEGRKLEALQIRLHGSGEWEFEFHAEGSNKPHTGHGTFWHINEQDIGRSLIKSVLLQKEIRPGIIEIMSGFGEQQIAPVIQEMLRNK